MASELLKQASVNVWGLGCTLEGLGGLCPNGPREEGNSKTKVKLTGIALWNHEQKLDPSSQTLSRSLESFA